MTNHSLYDLDQIESIASQWNMGSCATAYWGDESHDSWEREEGPVAL